MSSNNKSWPLYTLCHSLNRFGNSIKFAYRQHSFNINNNYSQEGAYSYIKSGEQEKMREQ